MGENIQKTINLEEMEDVFEIPIPNILKKKPKRVKQTNTKQISQSTKKELPKKTEIDLFPLFKAKMQSGIRGFVDLVGELLTLNTTRKDIMKLIGQIEQDPLYEFVPSRFYLYREEFYLKDGNYILEPQYSYISQIRANP